MTKFYDLSMTNFIFLFVINQAILQGTQITILYKHKRQRISTYALFRLILPISSTFQFPLILLCTHYPPPIAILLLPSHVPLYRHLLLSKAYTRNLRYLPLNLDYENDNLISSVSSESYTPLPRLSFSPIL